jgi:hypothetical protein
MDPPDTDALRERTPQEHTIQRLGDLLTELHRLLAEVLTSPPEDACPCRRRRCGRWSACSCWSARSACGPARRDVRNPGRRGKCPPTSSTGAPERPVPGRRPLAGRLAAAGPQGTQGLQGCGMLPLGDPLPTRLVECT